MRNDTPVISINQNVIAPLPKESGSAISNPITAWLEEDRPREKMLLKGKAALTDAELVAILIGSGTVGMDAIELGKQILGSVNGNLSELGRRSLKDLQKFKGIGEAKAITIAAALEIGRRRQFSDMMQRDSITCSRDAYDAILPQLIDLPNEEFWILMLNRASHIISRHRVSIGGVAGVVVDAKMVFKPAIEALASSIILIHNHPSGNLKPSKADIELTRKLRKAGESLDIVVADHVIVAQTGYYSFADEGMMY
jgi:DNA repair protein RadC